MTAKAEARDESSICRKTEEDKSATPGLLAAAPQLDQPAMPLIILPGAAPLSDVKAPLQPEGSPQSLACVQPFASEVGRSAGKDARVTGLDSALPTSNAEPAQKALAGLGADDQGEIGTKGVSEIQKTGLTPGVNPTNHVEDGKVQGSDAIKQDSLQAQPDAHLASPLDATFIPQTMSLVPPTTAVPQLPPSPSKVNVSSKLDAVNRTSNTDQERTSSVDTKAHVADTAPTRKRLETEGAVEQRPVANKPGASDFAAKLIEMADTSRTGASSQAASASSVTTTTAQTEPSSALQSDPKAVADPSASRPAAQPSPDANPLNGISSAQLVQSIHQSEMKVGMHSAEFGSISISTSLNHQAISAQISTDHTELTRALAMHLPAMQEKLGDAYGVQARVELRDGGSASSANNREQGSDDGQAGRSTGAISGLAGMTRAAKNTTSVLPQIYESSRLDVRA